MCGCGTADLDKDSDGMEDCRDSCPEDNPDDSDSDSVCDSLDMCWGDDEAGDFDGDNVCSDLDSCPLDTPDDQDSDGRCFSNDRCHGFDDSIDSDFDGIPDACDSCPLDPAPNEDADGDSYCNSEDECPNNPLLQFPGVCGCEAIAEDQDSDGNPDCIQSDSIEWFAATGARGVSFEVEAKANEWRGLMKPGSCLPTPMFHQGMAVEYCNCLVALSTGTNTTSLWRAPPQEDGRFTFLLDLSQVLDMIISDLSWCDFTWDGIDDIVVVGTRGSVKVVEVWSILHPVARLGVEASFLQRLSTRNATSSLRNDRVTCANFNNAATPDVVSYGPTEFGGAYFDVFWDVKSSGYTGEEMNHLAQLVGGDVEVGDYTRDGYLDMVITGTSPLDGASKTLMIRYEVGAMDVAGQSVFIADDVLNGAADGTVSFGDYDRDDWLDLLLCGSEFDGSSDYVEHHCIVFRNEQLVGSRRRFVRQWFQFPPLSHSRGLWIDLDLDGYLDVLLSGRLVDCNENSDGNDDPTSGGNGSGCYVTLAYLNRLDGNALSYNQANSATFPNLRSTSIVQFNRNHVWFMGFSTVGTLAF